MTSEISVRNPRTGKNDYAFTSPSRATLETIAKELREAQKQWEEIGLDVRIEVLQKFTSALSDNREAIVSELTRDTGRLQMSEIELEALIGIIHERCQYAPDIFEGLGGHARDGSDLRFEQNYVPHELVGIVSPWNYPLILSFLDAVPALLMGCAVIIKPSEVTPRFVEPVMAALEGVPELQAVLTLVQGAGDTGESIIDLTDTLVFTGSVATGRKVLERAASQFKTVFLELGGKDAAIVLEGSHPETAAEIVVRGAVENSGQLCSSVERVYVHESLAEAFIDEVCRITSNLAINYPDIRKGEIGPVIFDRQVEVLRSHLSDAREKGAKIIAGGNIVEHEGGVWCEPTVIIDVHHQMKIMSEETFGPIVPIMTFQTDEQALEMANDSVYGLSATVIGPEDRALPIGRKLKAGGIWINDFDTIGAVGEQAEKNAFNTSGIGGSRYGPGGFLRFVKKQALVIRKENQ